MTRHPDRRGIDQAVRLGHRRLDVATNDRLPLAKARVHLIGQRLRPATIDVEDDQLPDAKFCGGGCDSGVREVWVNGKRIRLPLYPTGMAAARALVGVPPRARFTYVPVSVLSDIAPEHILEINYHDCFDASMAAVGSVNAMFIVLKPGVDYLQDVGSFVLDGDHPK